MVLANEHKILVWEKCSFMQPRRIKVNYYTVPVILSRLYIIFKISGINRIC